MKTKKKSWKTTTLGVLAAVGILVGQATAILDADPETIFRWDQVTLALGALGIGFFSRDNNVSSEDVGAK